MTTSSKNRPFWLLTVAAFLAPTMPRLVSEGTFLDGLLYGVLSRNLAAGVGSAWKPYLTPTLTPEFFSDHPPLGFVLESLFFRAFGDHVWIESLYSLCTAVATGALIVLLWRWATRASPELRSSSWLPVLLWTTVPLVSWSLSNNMLENTLAVFVLGAAWLIVASLERSLLILPAAVCLVAGLFTKGPVALFPLALFPLAWMLLPGVGARVVVGRACLLVVAVAALTGVVLIAGDARENVSRYLQTQFLASLEGERGAVSNRLGIVEKLCLEIAPMLGVATLTAAVARWRWGADGIRGCTMGVTRYAWLFVLVGFCGSLPIAASPRQSGFYLVPSFPFFAVGVALFIAPIVRLMVGAMPPGGARFRAFAWTSAVILAGVVGYSLSQAGSIGRDRTTIEDVKTIGAHVGDGVTLGVCPSMARDWTLQGYFARYFRVTLDPQYDRHPFVVLGMDRRCPEFDAARFEPVPLGTRSLSLQRRR